jgi:hypothetical protein
MLTHESPAATPVRKAREVARTNPLGFPETARIESAASRKRGSRVWSAIRSELLIHGHMRIPDKGITGDGRRVVSMGCDAQQGNLALLDVETLELDVATLRQIRAAGARPSQASLALRRSGPSRPTNLGELRVGWEERDEVDPRHREMS